MPTITRPMTPIMIIICGRQNDSHRWERAAIHVAQGACIPSSFVTRISASTCRPAVRTAMHPAEGHRPGRRARRASDLVPALSRRSSSWCRRPGRRKRNDCVGLNVASPHCYNILHQLWNAQTSSTCAWVCCSRRWAAICCGVRGPPTMPSSFGSPAGGPGGASPGSALAMSRTRLFGFA